MVSERESAWHCTGDSLRATLAAIDDVHNCTDKSVLPKSSQKMVLCLTRRLQACPTNKKAVNVCLLRQVGAILLCHAAAVDDASLLGRVRRNYLCEPFAYRGMDFLSLFGGSHLSCTDGPAVVT